MRRILLSAGLVILLAGAALAQSARIVPCIVDVGAAGADGTYFAMWVPRTAEKTIFKIEPGTQTVIPFSMPVSGRCEARFQAFDDRDEAAVKYQDASGNALTKRPKGDVEVSILDGPGMAARNKDEKYAARYAGGLATRGEFNTELAAGDYFVVISNKHTDKIPKYVVFWFGRPEKER